jgi:hypothetical protein
MGMYMCEGCEDIKDDDINPQDDAELCEDCAQEAEECP